MEELTILQEKFQSLMMQYQSEYENTQSMREYASSTFLGQSALLTQSATSSGECANQCLENSKCTGATFFPSVQSCQLRAGEGRPQPQPQPGGEEIALVRRWTLLKQINSELINTYQAIQAILPQIRDKQAVNEKHITEQNTTLTALLKEQAFLDRQLAISNTIDQQSEDSTMLIDKYALQYFLLGVGAMILGWKIAS